MRLCTKPFIGAIKPPRDHRKWSVEETVSQIKTFHPTKKLSLIYFQAKLPEIDTDIEYVHGYRVKD
jgi:hypothetical protein